MKNEAEYQWNPVRRLANWDRRNKMGIFKGYTKQRQERRLSVSKHVTVEDDVLSHHAGSDGESGKEIASMLCNMPQEKLLEVVQHCPHRAGSWLRRHASGERLAPHRWTNDSTEQLRTCGPIPDTPGEVGGPKRLRGRAWRDGLGLFKIDFGTDVLKARDQRGEEATHRWSETSAQAIIEEKTGTSRCL